MKEIRLKLLILLSLAIASNQKNSTIPVDPEDPNYVSPYDRMVSEEIR